MTDEQCKQNPIFIVNVDENWSIPRVVGLCFCLVTVYPYILIVLRIYMLQ